jgi:hypothetical protein
MMINQQEMRELAKRVTFAGMFLSLVFGAAFWVVSQIVGPL